MTNDTVLQAFLHDVGGLLRDHARAAQAARDAARDDEERVFAQGRLFAYLEVVALLQHELDVFALDRDVMQLATLDPERDLL